MVKVGDRFTMKPDSDPYEVRNPKTGRHLATFLPGLGYRVTGLNLDIANGLINDGLAVAGGASLPERLAAAREGVTVTAADVGQLKPDGKGGFALGADPGKVSGSVRIGGKASDKKGK